MAAALTPAPALAVTKTWSGLGGDSFWFTDANWQGGARPMPNDDLVFPAGASRLTNTNNFPAVTTFHTITISGSGYTLNGNSVAITSSQHITASHPSGTTSTINLSISGAATSIDVTHTGATLVLGGTLTNSAALAKGGTGTAVLLGTSTATLGWTVGQGILNVQNGGALGSKDTLVDPGATLQVQGGITVPTSILLRTGGAANATGGLESVSGSNTLTGSITLIENSTVSADAGSSLTVSTNPVVLFDRTLTANVAGTATIASPIQGTGVLTKTGTGVLTLTGTNTYTGPTTVTAGTLLVTGSQPASSVTVNGGATLGGTGTTGPVTTTGILTPGVGGPGLLHSGNATFNGGSTFAVDLNGTTVGTGYDELFVAGPVTLLGPTLTVSVGFPSAPGNTFIILQSTGAQSGAFAGLPEGTTFVSGERTFRTNYTTNAVTLTDVTPTLLLGDFNGDGFVDIRDYGVWRQNFGQGNCGNAADADGNCLVDIRDYGIWRQHFGEGTPADRRGDGALSVGLAPAPRGPPGPAQLGGDPADYPSNHIGTRDAGYL